MIKLGFTCKICKERKEKTLLNPRELTDNIITSICYECMGRLKDKPTKETNKSETIRG